MSSKSKVHVFSHLNTSEIMIGIPVGILKPSQVPHKEIDKPGASGSHL
jgi:hypothetical protein